MKKNGVTFVKYVNQSLNSYRWITSISISLIVAITFTTISLSNKISSDKRLLSVLAPYFSTLIESEDRPEVIRFIQSIAKDNDVEVVVVHNDVLFADSKTINDLDLPFNRPKPVFRFLDSEFTPDQIINQKEIISKNGNTLNAQIFLMNPLRPIAINVVLFGLICFWFCIFISWFSSRRMKLAIKNALNPLSVLHEEIQKLHKNVEFGTAPIQIQELEEIRLAIYNTKIALDQAKDGLANEKAKKLSAESYKRLIHDLQNPVAALGQMVRILTNPATDAEDSLFVATEIPKIAEQLLNQVSAAKYNLENEPQNLHESDLRTCVQASFDQVMRTLSKDNTNKLNIVIPTDPIVSAHDPLTLQRAIINLIENAVEASQEKVLLTLEKTSTHALIKVSDDGCGMDESKVSLHLQGKGQSSKANRQAFGLSSVKHIVCSHGGQIIYEKNAIGGASFEIRLEVSV